MSGGTRRTTDGRLWHNDRQAHAADKPRFTWHAGTVAYKPTLRIGSKKSPDRHWMRVIMYERGNGEDGRYFEKKWAVYAFSELARWSCESLRAGDRILVVGVERGLNTWVDDNGEEQTVDDLAAYELGLSLLRNPAYSERNEPSASARNHRRIEEGYGPAGQPPPS